MIRELDTVVLKRDIDEFGLRVGDAGAVVHDYTDGLHFEVEFVAHGGRTIALLTLDLEDIRPMTPEEILIPHARPVARA